MNTQAKVLSLPYLLVNLGYLNCRVATGFTKPCLVFAVGLFIEATSSCPSIVKHVRHYDFERRYNKNIVFILNVDMTKIFFPHWRAFCRDMIQLNALFKEMRCRNHNPLKTTHI